MTGGASNEKPGQALLRKQIKSLLGKLHTWHDAGRKLTTRRLRDDGSSLYYACRLHFGSCRKAIKAAGLHYEGHRGRQFWDKTRVRERLRHLHEKGADLSWTGLAKRDYSLAQAAIRYWGRYPKALKAAGIDDKQCRRRRPEFKWTRSLILSELARLYAQGEDLSVSRMLRNHRGLAPAAIRQFKSYAGALEAAGIDYQKIRRTRLWDKARIIEIIKREHQSGRSISFSAMDHRLPRLRAASQKHFGSYAGAVRAAGIDYQSVGKLNHWTKSKLIQSLRTLARQKQDLRYSVATRDHGPLAHSAVWHFGSYAAAMRAAGIPYDNGLRLLTRKQVLGIILADDKAGRDIRISQVRHRHRGLESGANRHFGNYRKAVLAAGLDYPPLKPLAYWTRPRVLRELVRLHREGADLRYEVAKKSRQPLFAAARYYFGKYHRAVTATGIPPSAIRLGVKH